MTEMGIYAGLFLIAFLAATVLPAQSELGLAGLVVSGSHSVILLVAVASAGNILGALANWALGRGIESFAAWRRFRGSPDRLSRATRWHFRYGRWSLLLSWAPVLGAQLTSLSAVMRDPSPSFSLA